MSCIKTTLCTLYHRMFNPFYKPDQGFYDYVKYGSKNDFYTKIYINGEYFRSRSNNQYFCVVGNQIEAGELSGFKFPFTRIDLATKVVYHDIRQQNKIHVECRKYDPTKDHLLRLVINPHKKYFIDADQKIWIFSPDVIVETDELKSLECCLYDFEEVPLHAGKE